MTGRAFVTATSYLLLGVLVAAMLLLVADRSGGLPRTYVADGILTLAMAGAMSVGVAAAARVAGLWAREAWKHVCGLALFLGPPAGILTGLILGSYVPGLAMLCFVGGFAVALVATAVWGSPQAIVAGWVGIWSLGCLLIVLGSLDTIFATPTDTTEGPVGGYAIMIGFYFGVGGIAVLTVAQAAALGVAHVMRKPAI